MRGGGLIDPNGGRTRLRRVCRCGLHLSHKQGTASQAWFSFSGTYGIHTGINAGRRRGNDACRTRLRVALATIHESLANVPRLLTKELLRKVVRITAESMARDFAVKSPRIAVAGLNPHAGEAGKFGARKSRLSGP